MKADRSIISFEAGDGLNKMIEQRALQEGITVSQYLREAVYFELVFSGDLEAMSFVGKRLGKRVKEILLDKLGRVDVTASVQALGVE